MNSGPCDKSSRPASKGFYRQPNIQRIRPSQSNCEVRRKQFSQKLMWYSDASEAGLLDPHQAEVACAYQRRHSSAEVYQKPSSPTSILKRTESNMDSIHLTPTSFRTDRRVSTSSVRKSAHFKENVDVIYYDQQERPTSSAARDQEKLKDEKNSAGNITERTSQIRCNLHPEGACNKEMFKNPDSDFEKKIVTSKPIFEGKEVNIVRDENGGFKWKLFVPIGVDFIRNRTSVKALSGGKKLILMAYKFDKCEGGVHQYVERLSLPHPIDAYGVKATMDKDGNLKISAPLVSTDVSYDKVVSKH